MRMSLPNRSAQVSCRVKMRCASVPAADSAWMISAVTHPAMPWVVSSQVISIMRRALVFRQRHAGGGLPGAHSLQFGGEFFDLVAEFQYLVILLFDVFIEE